MTFIDDSEGFESISTIVKIPNMATGWPCIDCRNTISTPDTICPTCMQERINTQLEYTKNKDILRLGGLKAYNNFTLEKYTNKSAIDKCSEYPNANYFIWGSAGTGKTHLSTALVRQYPGGCVIKPQHIYRKCRGLKSGVEEQSAIDYYVNIPYLVIDDLGVDKKTDFSFSTLYEIIEGRDMQEKGGLIITSNLSLGLLEQRLDDGRITSRLAGMCKVIEITGSDHRIS